MSQPSSLLGAALAMGAVQKLKFSIDEYAPHDPVERKKWQAQRNAEREARLAEWKARKAEDDAVRAERSRRKLEAAAAKRERKKLKRREVMARQVLAT
jgi:hypothetical protein